MQYHELGNPYKLPETSHLFFNAHNITSPFPLGAVLFYVGEKIGDESAAQTVIAAYLDNIPYRDGQPKHGEIDVKTLFNEVLIYEGHYSGNSTPLQFKECRLESID